MAISCFSLLASCLLLLAASQRAPALPPVSYNTTITVNSTDPTGKCFQPEPRCGNLTAALLQAQEASNGRQSVRILLSAGCFSLESSAAATFNKWEDFGIFGEASAQPSSECIESSSDAAVALSHICCSGEGVGMSFVNSSGIVMQNVLFSGCRAEHASTSVSSKQADQFEPFQAALYFLSCANVEMYAVTVCSSGNTSVALYNTSGSNMFKSCHFDRCYDPGDLIGAGVMVEFIYCYPGDTTCKDKPSQIISEDSSYNFTSCTFCGNVATGASVRRFRPLYPHGAEHTAFNKGAGLSVHFKGKTHRNKVAITDCVFDSNSAELGSGLYLGFMDESVNNTVHISDSNFTSNLFDCGVDTTTWRASGGGARIEFVHYPPDPDLWPNYSNDVSGNSVSFCDASFQANMVCLGGAVSFVTSRDQPGQSSSNSLSFDHCNFTYNQANIGGVVDLSLFGPDTANTSGDIEPPLFTNCRFVGNIVTFANFTNYKASLGNFYANQVPAKFAGSTLFDMNIESAFAVKDTYVSVLEDSEIIFTRNTGRNGGAISFIGKAWLVAYENSTFNFTKNSVDYSGLGGAIYAAQFGDHGSIQEHDCFFRYYQYTKNPDLWNVSVIFSENSANGVPNSIYTTSISPCLWPEVRHTPRKVFCRKQWVFDSPTTNSCISQVLTGPAKVGMNSKTIKVVPGWSNNLGIHIVDDYNATVVNVMTAASINSSLIVVDPSTEYIVDGNLIVHGIVNKHTSVELRTLDPRVIVYNVDVTVLECPPLYRRSYCNDSRREMVCSCKCQTEGIFNCSDDRDNATAEIYFGYCLTKDREGSETLILGKCLYSVSDTRLPQTAEELDDVVCGPYNRTGTLCGKCRDGKGVAVNSYQLECMDCHFGYFFAYIALEILPITIFLIIVAVFNISGTSAAMNAYIFFSQMITVSYFHNTFPWAFGFGYSPITPSKARSLKIAFLFPYSIWNLDFFASVAPPFCLTASFEAIHVLLFSYIKAFYPLVLIVVCYLCIELHDRNFRCIRVLWKPFRYLLYRFRRTWEPKTSIIDAFATFLLLAYTKLMYVSFSLLVPVTLLQVSDGELNSTHRFYFDAEMDIFGHPHVWYALVALLVLAVFVVLPPIFLLLYPLRCVQQCLTKCRIRWRGLHTFADAFQGSFKDGTNGTRDWRYFASAYFFFRIIGFVIYISEPFWLVQYLVQQILVSLAIFTFAVVRPYKKDFYNGLDAGLFTLLAIINSMSFFNSHRVALNQDISLPIFIVNYVLLFVPLLYIVCYITFLYLRLKGCFVRKKKLPLSRATSESMLVVENTTSNTDPLIYTVKQNTTADDMPDRLLHPENYQSNTPSPRSSNKTATTSSTNRSDSSSNAQSGSNSRELGYPVSDRERLLVVSPQAEYGAVQRRHTEPPMPSRDSEGTIN